MRHVALLLAAFGVGCSAVPYPKTVAPCSDEALAAIVLECRARKLTECSGMTDESCPLIAECDQRIDQWEACDG